MLVLFNEPLIVRTSKPDGDDQLWWCSQPWICLDNADL